MENQFNNIKNFLRDTGLSLHDEKYTALLEALDKAEEVSFYNRIGILFDNCDRIRSNIELLEGMSQSISKNSNTSGIIYSKKIKLFLLGDFSSGKTTFIKRLLSKLVGVSSQFPQTSSIIKHFGSSSRMLMIIPCKTYTPPAALRFEFSKIVRKFGLEKYFTQKGDTWSAEEENISISHWQNTEIVDFVGAIDRYPGFIASIDWGHKLTDNAKKHSLLDYSHIYDVPGIGGEIEHDRVVDAAVNESPDIILYLVDSSRGIPGDNEEKSLINIALKNPNAHFFWCYQKKSENKSEDFIDSQENELENFITSMLDKARDKTINSFELQAVKTFFDSATVVDARGDVNDNFSAIDEVTKVISKFYLRKTAVYISSKKSELLDIPDRPEILNARENPEQLIIQKLNVLASQNDARKLDLYRLLNSIFENDLISDHLKKHGNSAFAAFISENAHEVVDKIVSKSIRDDRNKILIKVWDSHKNVIDDDARLDYNFLKRDFEELYNSKNYLQVKIPLLQACILYVLYSDSRLERIYRKDIESHIIRQVEQDLELLEKSISM